VKQNITRCGPNETRSVVPGTWHDPLQISDVLNIGFNIFHTEIPVFTDHSSGPGLGRAIGPMCAYVCVSGH